MKNKSFKKKNKVLFKEIETLRAVSENLLENNLRLMFSPKRGSRTHFTSVYLIPDNTFQKF